MIHQNVTHQLSGNAKKVSSVLPLWRVLVKEAQVGFVNQCSALESVIGALAPEVSAGDAAQLLVDQGNQLFACVLITKPPVDEQLADPRGRCWAHLLAPVKVRHVEFEREINTPTRKSTAICPLIPDCIIRQGFLSVPGLPPEDSTKL